MPNTTNGPVLGKAGRFEVFADLSFSGPADYLAEGFDAEKVQYSAALLAAAAPQGITVEQLLAVALQTDYAAWVGARELAGRCG